MVVDELDTVRIHDGLRQIDLFFLNNRAEFANIRLNSLIQT